MKKLVALLALGLVGCTTTGDQSVTLIHKQGSTYNQRVAAFDQCKIASFRAIPQTMKTDVVGGYSNPGTLQCNTFNGLTNCNRIGAVNIPAQSYTSDVNDDMRVRFIAQCLSKQGYQLGGTRRCSSQEETALANKQANNQPAFSQIRCVSTPTLDRGFLF